MACNVICRTSLQIVNLPIGEHCVLYIIPYTLSFLLNFGEEKCIEYSLSLQTYFVMGFCKWLYEEKVKLNHSWYFCEKNFILYC